MSGLWVRRDIVVLSGPCDMAEPCPAWGVLKGHKASPMVTRPMVTSLVVTSPVVTSHVRATTSGGSSSQDPSMLKDI